MQFHFVIMKSYFKLFTLKYVYYFLISYFTLTEVEKLYEEALLKEEERIAYQRKLLLLYQRQIREREQQILEETRNSAIRKNVSAKENELEKLLKNFERKVSSILFF